MESTLLLEQPVVTTFAINLRHLQNYRNGASLFQRGVTISQPSKDISASWKEVIDQLQAIRKDWDF